MCLLSVEKKTPNAPFWPGVHGVVVALDAVDLQNGVVFLEALIIRHHAVGALLRRGPSGGFRIYMGIPSKWMVFIRENPMKWDDLMIWGYAYFRKAPYRYGGGIG